MGGESVVRARRVWSGKVGLDRDRVITLWGHKGVVAILCKIRKVV